VIEQINLSSRPYRNRALPWILAAALLLISFFGAFFVFVEYEKVTAQTKAVKEEIARIDPQIAELKRRGEQIRQSLTPEQQILLRTAHELVAEKRFSWSRLFGDLESVLPREVSVSKIGVNDVIDSGGGKMLAELDFSVMSRDYGAVDNMIANMNNSGIFQAELRSQDLQRDKGNLTEYTLRLRYAPRAGMPIAETGLVTAQNK
jgi:Tfp pilus assembly protein PilN